MAGAVAVAVVGGLVGTGAGTASADPGAETGTVRVSVSAPDGVPANVALSGRAEYVAATSTQAPVTELQVPWGAYRVGLPPVTVDGVRYLGSSSRPEVVVRQDETSTLEVTYVAEPGARRLRGTGFATDSLELAWDAPEGDARYTLRRTPGRTPAPHRLAGVQVPVTGTTAQDSGLAAGSEYTYALWTQDHSRWHGPLVVTISTRAPEGSDQATFVAAPTTLIAAATDLAAVATTGDGVLVRLAPHVPTPLLGAAVVLPVSELLEGGYLGQVVAVSDDGREVRLEGAALDDAFDFYDLSVQEFAESYDDALAEPQDSGQPATGPSSNGFAKQGPAASGNALVSTKCSGKGSQTVTYTPGMDVGGYFRTTVDKWNVFGKQVPVGATIDLGFSTTLRGAAAVKTTGSWGCGLDLKPVFKQLSAYPVPIALRLTPTAGFTVGGALDVSNIGMSATAGIDVSGTLSVKNGASFSADPYLSSTQLQPVTKVNGSVGLKVGGALTVGPGAGTKKAGVIAGVTGELYFFDGSWEPYFTYSDSRFNTCTTAKAEWTRQLSLQAQAWLGKWSMNQKVEIPALKGSTPYGGPWHLPKGCENTQPDDKDPDSVLGDGVEKVDDETVVGAEDQWGKVDGFVPGQRSWVLSTGRIGDTVGSPSFFASTGLGRSGDPQLSALSGNTTYDAASYSVTVVPEGSTLNVRYVFASEEYPEYVGSRYNDVMAVFVDGKNCAVVPGTQQAVSINTINHRTNSQYYVDNTQGAAGYGTSMDGLTVPLTCSVPVTPGQPVTVKIAVADASDSAYDSAVALVDGGIFSS